MAECRRRAGYKADRVRRLGEPVQRGQSWLASVPPCSGCPIPPCSSAVLHAPPAPQARAARQLPGAEPQLLAAAPAVWVVLPGNPWLPRAAGALLVLVHTTEEEEGAGAAAQQLRLLVYSREDDTAGVLLERRDWLLQSERTLRDHPLFCLPSWDSG